MLRQIYLNNAAAAYPLWPEVIEAVETKMKSPPSQFGRGSGWGEDDIEECRKNIAEMLKVLPKEVALTSGGTLALNMAILGLGLRRGDLVVTSVAEHNSVLRPLARLEDEIGIVVKFIGINSKMELDEETARPLWKHKPKAVILSHASNVSGRIYEVSRFFQIAKENGAVTILDASQSVGRISLNPALMNADMVAFTGHKGLRGPLGTGILYVSMDVEINSVLEGGTGFWSQQRRQPLSRPMLLEVGTPNTVALAGLNVAVINILKMAKEIRKREMALTAQLISGLKSIKGVRIVDENCDERLAIVSFVVDGQGIDAVGFALWESFGILGRAGLHCAPMVHQYFGSWPEGTIRLSPSFMTQEDDLEYTTEAVKRIAK